MMASLYTPAQLIPLPTLLLAPVRVGHQQGEGSRKVLSVGFVDPQSVWEEVRPQWLLVTRAGKRAGRRRRWVRASSMECQPLL